MATDLRRVFTHAIVRRIAYVLVALVLSYIGMGRAEAATRQQAYDSALGHKVTTCQGYRREQTIVDQTASKRFKSTVTCYVWSSGAVYLGPEDAYYPYTDNACPAGTRYYHPTASCTATCDVAADESPNMPSGKIGDVYCSPSNGCEYVGIDDTGDFLTSGATGAQCWTQGTALGTPTCLPAYTAMTIDGRSVCRPTDTDGDGIPDMNDDFPNDPAESQDSDSDGVGDNGDHAPDDPTNGKDEDEEGGDEGDNTSIGGGNCSTPPESHGDGILAQIAFQTWHTRCKGEAANAHLADILAAIEAQGPNGGGGGSPTNMDPTNAKLDALNDKFETEGADLTEGPSGTGADAFLPSTGGFTPDAGGFLGGGGSCPVGYSFTVGAQSFTFGGPDSGLCKFFDIGRALVLLFAALACRKVMMGGIG